MKHFRIWAALALALFATQAAAQPSPGSSPWPITKGGTGAITAAAARTALGVQALDAELTAIAGLVSAADQCFYFTGSGTAALASCPTYGRSLMATASAAAARTALVLVPGTDVQAQDIELAALAGLTSAADKCPYFTGSGTAALMDCSSALRTFLTTPNSANLLALLTNETGTGAAMFNNAPQVVGLFDINGAIKKSTQSAPAQITSNQNDYNPSSVNCATTATLLINSDAARDITGLAGGVTGCEMGIVNNGAFTITLKEENASSTAANRFKTGADISLAANASLTLRYDGTASRWRLASLAPAAGAGTGTVTSVACGTGLSGGTNTTSGTCAVSLSTVTNSLSGDVSLSSTGSYFDGPSVAQGTSGTWWASGTVTISNSAASATVWCKLWDGTTVISSAQIVITAAGVNFGNQLALSGYLATPAGNIRISCRDSFGTTTSIKFNLSGNSKDSTVSVVRIN